MPGKIDALYQQYSKMIHLYLIRFVGDSAAEDLTQEVFLKVNSGLDKYRGDSSIKTWIYRIATNVAKDYLKSTAYKASVKQVPILESELEQFDLSLNSSTSPEESFRTNEMNECINEFIHRLPIKYSSVLALSELGDMKAKEISHILELSIGTVKVRLHRAREKLKSELEMGCNISTDRDNKVVCERK